MSSDPKHPSRSDGTTDVPSDESDTPEHVGPNPLHPDLDPTDPERDGTNDPLPNRGISELTFDELDSDYQDPSTIADEILFHNRFTCPNCYARLGRQWELPNSKRVEDLDEFVTYIRHEEPYQIPEDERSKLDKRYYQTETFSDRAGFDASPARYTPARRFFYCKQCGYERSGGDGIPTGTPPGDERGVELDDIVTEHEDTAGGGTGRRSLASHMLIAETVIDTLDEYGIAVNEHALLSTVDEIVRLRDFSDEETFRVAVAESVRINHILA